MCVSKGRWGVCFLGKRSAGPRVRRGRRAAKPAALGGQRPGTPADTVRPADPTLQPSAELRKIPAAIPVAIPGAAEDPHR